MSDFDKEAEREKLRKQFAEDEKKRKSTERMSELLLQGATMTDSHCDTCGDPIFRYEGQEFCPSCQTQSTDGQTQVTTDQQEQHEDRSAEEVSQATNIEIEDGEETNARDVAADESNAETQPTEPSSSTPRTDSSQASESTPTSPPAESRGRPNARAQSQSQHQPTDLSEARQSLVRTITRFAERAETVNDLEHARTFLAATEDAAEALEAIKRAET